MLSLSGKYKAAFRQRGFVFSLISAILLVLVGAIVTYFAIIYVNIKASNPVTDIVLSNTPVMDVDGIFVWGPIIFWIAIGLHLLFEPKKMPFTLKSVALFVLIRSAFISMTHIGPFPTHAVINSSGGFLSVFTTGNDFFFSSHTGLPFLMAFVFWDNKYLRYFCIAASIFFGTIVLLGHLHYSIDVFAAFFITYTIFIIAGKLFKKDWAFFKKTEEAVS